MSRHFRRSPVVVHRPPAARFAGAPKSDAYKEMVRQQLARYAPGTTATFDRHRTLLQRVLDFVRRVWTRLASLALLVLLTSCASAPTVERHCYTTPCGDVCCNDDGRLCPPCETK